MRLVTLTSRFTGDPFLILGISLGITTSKCQITKVMAERVGFEPTLEFPLNTLSKRAPSATRPSLRRRLGLESLYRLLEMKTDGAMVSIHLIAATPITMGLELCECTRIGQKIIGNL